MSTSATIVSIVYKPQHKDFQPPKHFSRTLVEEVRLVKDYGIEGDSKGGSETRQLNIMSQETLDTLATEGFTIAPGKMGEQLIVSGMNIDSLQSGDRLQLGNRAVIEIIQPRTGCNRFQRIQGKHPSKVEGRLGMMAKVVEGGLIRVNASVAIMLPEPDHV